MPEHPTITTSSEEERMVSVSMDFCSGSSNASQTIVHPLNTGKALSGSNLVSWMSRRTSGSISLSISERASTFGMPMCLGRYA